MAFTLVQSVFAASPDTNSVTTVAKDFSAADLIVLLAVSYQAATAPAVSDSQTNSYATDLTEKSDTGQGRAKLFYKKSPAVSGSQTFSLTGTGTYCAVCALGFSGSNTTTQYDSPNENGASMGGGTTFQPGSVTPSTASSLLVTGLTWSAPGTMSINSSFNLVTGQIDFNGGVNFGIAAAWKETSGAENPTWTCTSSEFGGVVMASFLPVGGGGGGSTIPPLMDNYYRRRI